MSKGAFIKAGDSGSLLVTDPAEVQLVCCSPATGAVSSAIANRIDLVLEAFGGTPNGDLTIDDE